MAFQNTSSINPSQVERQANYAPRPAYSSGDSAKPRSSAGFGGVASPNDAPAPADDANRNFASASNNRFADAAATQKREHEVNLYQQWYARTRAAQGGVTIPAPAGEAATSAPPPVPSYGNPTLDNPLIGQAANFAPAKNPLAGPGPKNPATPLVISDASVPAPASASPSLDDTGKSLGVIRAHPKLNGVDQGPQTDAQYEAGIRSEQLNNPNSQFHRDTAGDAGVKKSNQDVTDSRAATRAGMTVEQWRAKQKEPPVDKAEQEWKSTVDKIQDPAKRAAAIESHARGKASVDAAQKRLDLAKEQGANKKEIADRTLDLKEAQGDRDYERKTYEFHAKLEASAAKERSKLDQQLAKGEITKAEHEKKTIDGAVKDSLGIAEHVATHVKQGIVKREDKEKETLRLVNDHYAAMGLDPVKSLGERPKRSVEPAEAQPSPATQPGASASAAPRGVPPSATHIAKDASGRVTHYWNGGSKWEPVNV